MADRDLNFMPNESLYVYPRLPSKGYGLGNMMFVWARAIIAAKTLNAPMLAPNWSRWYRIGPHLRREFYKRHYIGEFQNEGYIKGLAKYRILYNSQFIKEGEMQNSCNSSRHKILVFEGLKDHFFPLIPHRDIIAEELLRIVNQRIRRAIVISNSLKYIAVHVRRSDFIQLGQSIPLEWYIKASTELRNELNQDYPIFVFSDSSPEDLQPLSWPKDTFIMPSAPAVQHLLMIANAQAIVGTSLSTFSLWGSFLSGKITLWPPVSPGVFGYGLHTDNHVGTDWEGRLDHGVRYF